MRKRLLILLIGRTHCRFLGYVLKEFKEEHNKDWIRGNKGDRNTAEALIDEADKLADKLKLKL